MTPRVSIAGVIELHLAGRGPSQAFIFDPHRLALPSWAATGVRDALLITFDRHFDLLVPKTPPPTTWDLQTLDDYARHQLDPRNVDHIAAAMQAGIVRDVIAVARTALPQGLQGPTWNEHQLVLTPTLEHLTAPLSAHDEHAPSARAWQLLADAKTVLLDVDLDCFTSPSDADPRTTLPWPREIIHDFLMPEGSDRFWSEVLPKCRGLTFAREPGHCGGLIAAGRLFEAVAQVLFVELLRADLP